MPTTSGLSSSALAIRSLSVINAASASMKLSLYPCFSSSPAKPSMPSGGSVAAL